MVQSRYRQRLHTHLPSKDLAAFYYATTKVHNSFVQEKTVAHTGLWICSLLKKLELGMHKTLSCAFHGKAYDRNQNQRNFLDLEKMFHSRRFCENLDSHVLVYHIWKLLVVALPLIGKKSATGGSWRHYGSHRVFFVVD